MTRDELLTVLSEKIKSMYVGQPLIIGIDGIDTSGKTTITRLLNERIDNSFVLSIDMFHNKNSVRKREGDFSPEGYYNDSFNYQYLVETVLSKIRVGEKQITFKVFNHKEDDYVDEIKIDLIEKPIILFEGVFMHREELDDYYDLTIYLDITFEEMLERAKKRDLDDFISLDELLDKYERRYIEGQKIYIHTVNPTDKANIVIDNNDYNQPIINKI